MYSRMRALSTRTTAHPQGPHFIVMIKICGRVSATCNNVENDGKANIPLSLDDGVNPQRCGRSAKPARPLMCVARSSMKGGRNPQSAGSGNPFFTFGTPSRPVME